MLLSSSTAALPPTVSVSSVTATSVVVVWTQPHFSLPVAEYTVTLSRVTDLGQLSCPSVADNRAPVTRKTTGSLQFIQLHEFSVYTVTVMANFNNSVSSTNDVSFTTLSAGKIASTMYY